MPPSLIGPVTAGVALLLVAPTAATCYAVLRAPARTIVSGWTARRVLALCIAAAVPWLLVWRVPYSFVISAHSIPELLGWIVVALLVFAILVLLPLAALLSAIVWLIAQRRERA